jgi:hypothetical protein
MGQTRLGSLALPMTARQANRSDLANVGFFRYFILTHSSQSRHDWASTFVARIGGEVQVLFFHFVP